MEFETVPQGKNHNENFKKACEIIEERNEQIAKLFGVEKKEPTVYFCESTGYISKMISSLEKEFKGYVDCTDSLYLVHPDEGSGFFSELWPEMKALSDFVLVKYYLCKKYYPNPEDFKLYYKYVSEQLAQIASGKYQESVAKFEFKFYTKGKKLKKEPALGLLLYIMRENSGIEFIFKHLDKIMEDKDIEKTVQEIYKKSIDEMILPEKQKVLDEEKKKQELEKQKRQAAFNAEQKNYSTNNAQRPNSNNNKKFVTRDKFKAKNNDNKKSNYNTNKDSKPNFNKKPQNNK